MVSQINRHQPANEVVFAIGPHLIVVFYIGKFFREIQRARCPYREPGQGGFDPIEIITIILRSDPWHTLEISRNFGSLRRAHRGSPNTNGVL